MDAAKLARSIYQTIILRHMQHHKLQLVIIFCCSCLAVSSFALKCNNKTLHKNPWFGSNAQLGANIKSGNNDSVNAKGALHIYHRRKKWRQSYKIEARYGYNASVKTAENYYASAQQQYYFTGSNHFYLLSNGTYDEFNPYAYQALAAAGYGRDIINHNCFRWDLEAGPGYMFSRERDSKKIQDQMIIDLHSNIWWQITKTIMFHEDFDLACGHANTRTKSTTSLRNKINKHWGFQVSVKLENNSTIPPLSDKTEHLDTTTNIDLIYSF